MAVLFGISATCFTAIVAAFITCLMSQSKLDREIKKEVETLELEDEPLGPEALKALEKLREEIEPFTRFGFHSWQAMGVWDRGRMELLRAIRTDRENAKREQATKKEVSHDNA